MQRSSFTAMFLLTVAALHVYTKASHRPVTPKVGESVARLTAVDVDARGPKLAVLVATKRVTVIAFFETWCGPCKLELPDLEKLYQAHRSEGLGVVGIFGPSSGADIKGFVDSLGLTFPLIGDDQSHLAKVFGVDAVPTAVVVDEQLRVLHTARGVQPTMAATILDLLHAQASSKP